MKTRVRLLFSLIACAVFAVVPTSAQSSIDTYFTDKHGTFSGYGGYWYQQFTLSAKRTFVLRVAADYRADTAIIVPGQLSNFINNQGFSGYSLFDDSFGTKSVTLTAGTYYLAVRNQVSGTNTYRLELDYDIKVPADANYTYKFIDNYLQGTRTVGAWGGKLWHGFTVQSGYRYFLDGCNTGLSTYVIPAHQLDAFRNNSTFTYYTSYSGNDNAYPGLHEIKLPAGSYYLAFTNSNSIGKAVTYTMERWQRTPKTSGGVPGATIDLSGAAGWAISGSSINIKVAKVSNLATSGSSGSLRLRVWATKSRYTGSSITGYVLGTRGLNPLKANHYYSNVAGKVSYKRPPAGTYYTTITLEEYTGSGWRIRDYVNFSGTTRF